MSTKRTHMNDHNTSSQEPPSDFGIRLMEGEEVIFSLRPYRFVRYAVVFASITIVGIVFAPFAFLWAVIAVRRYHYWLTNKRVIWCHGFIGYQVRSVPLERIADVVISRTLPEIVAGISSIDIVADALLTRPSRSGCNRGSSWAGSPRLDRSANINRAHRTVV